MLLTWTRIDGAVVATSGHSWAEELGLILIRSVQAATVSHSVTKTRRPYIHSIPESHDIRNIWHRGMPSDSASAVGSSADKLCGAMPATRAFPSSGSPILPPNKPTLLFADFPCVFYRIIVSVASVPFLGLLELVLLQVQCHIGVTLAPLGIFGNSDWTKKSSCTPVQLTVWISWLTNIFPSHKWLNRHWVNMCVINIVLHHCCPSTTIRGQPYKWPSDLWTWFLYI